MPTPGDSQGPPPGFALFQLFCLGSILFQLVIGCLGGVGLFFSTNPFREIRGLDLSAFSTALFWAAMLLFAMSFPLAVAYAAAPFLPRKPWAWKFNLSLIGMGVMSPVFFLAIPVGKRWNEPAYRAWYHLPPPPAEPPVDPPPA